MWRCLNAWPFWRDGVEMGRYCLHGRNGTGSAAPEAAFAEAGVSIELVDVPRDPSAAEAAGLLKVNPRGQVPALVLPDGTAIAEGTAILLHIADAFPDAHLAPGPGSFARAHHDRWLSFLQANIYEGELRHYYAGRYTDDPDGAEAVRRAAVAYVRRHYQLLEAAITPGPYVFGADLTVLDLYIWNLVEWTDRAWLAAHCPKVNALADKVASRPAVAPLHARHFADGSA